MQSLGLLVARMCLVAAGWTRLQLTARQALVQWWGSLCVSRRAPGALAVMLTSSARASSAVCSSGCSQALPCSVCSVLGAMMALGATPPNASSTSSATQAPGV